MARSRNTDPVSSKLAAEYVEKSGKAETHRELCFAEVLANPGQTCGEIAKSIGLDRVAAARRLPELREMGLIESKTIRICSVANRRCLTWTPTKAAENAYLNGMKG